MSGVEPIEPHEYVYGGFEVMGDCGKCGHVREDSIHVTPERAGASMSGDRRKPKRAKDLRFTDEDYARMLEAQGMVCALCGNPPKKQRLHVDHDHRTGTVRGLLCFRCNRALPNYVTAEWLLRAYAYVNRSLEADAPDQWSELRATR